MSTLNENNIYTNEAERDAILKDTQKVMDILAINFFGFLSLYKLSDSRGYMKTYVTTEGKLRIQAIDDSNHDVSLAVKLAFDARLLNMTTVNNMTRLLALIKQRQLRSKDIDDARVREILSMSRFSTNRPSPRVLAVLNDFSDMKIGLEDVAERFWAISKLPEFKVISGEFREIVLKGQYLPLMKDRKKAGLDPQAPAHTPVALATVAASASPQQHQAPAASTSTAAVQASSKVTVKTTPKAQKTILNAPKPKDTKDLIARAVSVQSVTPPKQAETKAAVSVEAPSDKTITLVKSIALFKSLSEELAGCVKNNYSQASLDQFTSVYSEVGKDRVAMDKFVDMVDTMKPFHDAYTEVLKKLGGYVIGKAEFRMFNEIFAQKPRTSTVPTNYRLGTHSMGQEEAFNSYQKIWVNACFSSENATKEIMRALSGAYARRPEYTLPSNSTGTLILEKMAERGLSFDEQTIREIVDNHATWNKLSDVTVAVIGTPDIALKIMKNYRGSTEKVKLLEFLYENFPDIVSKELDRLADLVLNGDQKVADDFVHTLLSYYQHYSVNDVPEVHTFLNISRIPETTISDKFEKAFATALENTSLSYIAKGTKLITKNIKSKKLMDIVETKIRKDVSVPGKNSLKTSFVSQVLLNEGASDENKAIAVKLILEAKDKKEILNGFRSNEKLNGVVTVLNSLIEKGLVPLGDDNSAILEILTFAANKASDIYNGSRNLSTAKFNNATNRNSIISKFTSILFHQYASKGAVFADKSLENLTDEEAKKKVLSQFAQYVTMVPTIIKINQDVIHPNVPLEASRLPTLLKFNNVDIGESIVEGNSVAEIEKNAAGKEVTIAPLAIKDDDLADTEIERLSVSLDKFSRRKHGNIALKVLKSFSVNLPVQAEQVAAFKASNPHSEILDPAFHGTGTIAASFLLRYGFTVVPATDASVVGRMLGNGIYISNVTDKVAQYVSDNGYSRGLGQKGYVLEMEAVLGEEGRDYRAAGLGGDNIRSPEWCVKGGNKQLIIRKAYLVELVKTDTIAKMKKGMSMNEMKIMSFTERLDEDAINNEIPFAQVSHAFMDGIIPISEDEVVDFQDFKPENYGDHVSIEGSQYGPVVSFKNHDDNYETFVHRFAGDLMGDIDALRKFLALLGPTKE